MLKRTLWQRLVFGFALVLFLCYLGLVMLHYEVVSWRFWRKVRCVRTFFSNGKWVKENE